jgi:tetratricopeptide (TPR) repeat protein
MVELTLIQAIQEGVRLHREGRLSDAETVYRQILLRQPDFHPALHLLGVLASQGNNQPAAIELITKALARDPKQPEYWINLGTAFRRMANPDQAITCYRNALALDPNSEYALNNLGVALRDKGLYVESIAAFKKALAINPRNFEAQNNLGGSYHLAGRHGDAAEALRTAMAMNPGDPTVYNNLAVNLRILGETDEAIPLLREAIQLDPNYADAHNTLSAALMDAGKYDAAMEHAQRAAELNPNLAEALANVAALYQVMGKLDEALESNRKAIAVNPRFAGAYWNLGLIHLLRGNFAEGWPLYEWRLRVPQLQAPGYPLKRWDGSSLQGKRILLGMEQGLGDTIQFIRYVPQVAALGAKIYLAVQNELVDLIQESIKAERFCLHGEPGPACDFYCPIMSLPLMFKTELDSIPHSVPYLNPSTELAQRWERKMPPTTDKRLRVGLVWAGRPTHRNDRERSIQLSQLAPLISETVLFFNLQKGDAGKQAKTPPARMEILDYSGELENFAETAALIAQLDLVIAVDTAVAHLAGAMGKPVWVLLMTVPDFRWMMDREDSPWYPTMRLFRQKTSGQWSEVIGRVAEALRELTIKKQTPR